MDEKNYYVKIINPVKKTEYEVHRLRLGSESKFTAFDTLLSLKEKIQKAFPIHFTSLPQDVGFIEPSHGVKGKKKWLTTDDDLKDDV